ncbi:MAG: hypothetical protein GAK45_00144 [Pseudomonas citronellolis]|nr:MAG: hypothetical protein GAK45_00144 [Pseudomonas citronellolis]
MANSPAKRHFQQVTAALAAAAAAGSNQTMAGLNAYELQLSQLLNDRARLKGIQSTETKIELKRELLPAYDPYIAGVLSAGQGAQDEVVTTIMLWRLDIGDFSGGLDIAAYMFQYKLPMTDRFKRSSGCLVAEEIADAAIKTYKAGEEFDIDVLTRTAELTAEQDMPDQVRAKLHRALGLAALHGLNDENLGRSGQVAAGITDLKRAIELHESCGAKKELEAAERLQKKLADNG